MRALKSIFPLKSVNLVIKFGKKEMFSYLFSNFRLIHPKAFATTVFLFDFIITFFSLHLFCTQLLQFCAVSPYFSFNREDKPLELSSCQEAKAKHDARRLYKFEKHLLRDNPGCFNLCFNIPECFTSQFLPRSLEMRETGLNFHWIFLQTEWNF